MVAAGSEPAAHLQGVSTSTVINDQTTARDPKWRAAVSGWAKEQVATAPPLTEEAVRLVRGAFNGPPTYPAGWAEPALDTERQAG